MALPNDHVPHTTAIKRNRVGNMPMDRLLRRWSFLLSQVHFHSGSFRSRMDWAMRAAEMTAIQNEIARRGVPMPMLDSFRDQVADVAAIL